MTTAAIQYGSSSNWPLDAAEEMTVEGTELLKALKKDKPQPSEPTDAEKAETANELHDWLHGSP